MRLFAILLLGLTPFLAQADLKPMFLKINLSLEKDSCAAGEVIQFILTFTNTDDISHSILLPGSQKNGKKLVYFSYYSVEGNYYTEVAREGREISMNYGKQGNVEFKNLDPNESVSIPVYLNDLANYHKHIEAHHKLPDLPPGEYQVLTWYDPWDEPLAQYAFNIISPFFKGDQQPLAVEKLNIPEEGLISNYITLTISEDASPVIPPVSTEFCGTTCKLCEAIDIGNWGKVQRIIDNETYYNGESGMSYTDSSWRMPHRNIAWLYHGPDAILSSLPSYTYRRIIFKNKNGYHYFTATWQLGIVYPTRSRLKSLAYCLFRVNAPINASEVDYMKLIRFEEY